MKKEKFIGRAEKLDEFGRIVNALQNNNLSFNILIISGKQGTGKTFLLSRLMNFVQKSKFHSISMQGHYLSENSELFADFLENIGNLSRKLSRDIKQNDISFLNIFEFEKIQVLTDQLKDITSKKPVIFFVDDLEYMTISFLRLIFLMSQRLSSNRFLLVCSMDAENIEKILLPIVSSSEIGYKTFDVGSFYENEILHLLKSNKIKSDKLTSFIKSIFDNNIKKIKFIISNYSYLENFLSERDYNADFNEIIEHLLEGLGSVSKEILFRLSVYEDTVPYGIFSANNDIINDLAARRFLKIIRIKRKEYINFYLSDIKHCVSKKNEDNRLISDELNNIKDSKGFLAEHYKMLFQLSLEDSNTNTPDTLSLIDRYIMNNLYYHAIRLIFAITEINLKSPEIDHRILFFALNRLSICFSNIVYDNKYRLIVEKYASKDLPPPVKANFIYLYSQLLFLSGEVDNAFKHLVKTIDILRPLKQTPEICELLLDAYGTAFTRIPGFDAGTFISDFNKSTIISNNIRLKSKYLAKLAFINYKLGKYDKSKKLFKNILKNLENIEDKWLLADIYNNLGRAATYTSREEEIIIGYYLKSARLYRELGDLKGEHKPLNNLGILFSRSLGLSTGYYYLSLCVEISRFNNDYDSIALLSNNIVSIFYQYGDWDKALEYLTRSISYSRKIRNKNLYTIAVSNFMLINIFRGNLIIARQYSHIYKNEIKNITEKDKLLTYYKTMADLEFYDSRFNKAVSLLKTCFSLSQKYNFPKQSFDSALQLYEYYLLYDKDPEKIAEYTDYLNNSIVDDPTDYGFYRKIQAMNKMREGKYSESIDLIEDSISTLQNLVGYKIESAIVYLIASVIYLRSYNFKPDMLIYQKISQYYHDISLKMFADLDALNLLSIYIKMPFCNALGDISIHGMKSAIFEKDKHQFEKIINNLSNRINILENVVSRKDLTDSSNISENIVELLKDSLYTLNFTFKSIMNKVDNRIYSLSKSSQSLIDLLSISKKINSMLDTKDLFEIILESIINILQAERSFIFLSDETKLNLEAVYSINKTEFSCYPENNVIETSERSFADNKFLSGFVEIETADACNLSDKKRFYLAIPLNIEQKTIGCLYIDLPHNMANIDKTHMELAQLFAEYASTAIDKAHNIQELHSAMENLKTLDRLKSEFITIASHELRTPLVTIKGYLELLLNGLLGKLNDKQMKGLNLSNNNLERLIKLVDDIIIIAEIERGEESLYKEIFDINSLIPVLEAETKEYIEKRNQRLNIDLYPQPLEIYGDKDKIKSALMNILMNAIRFTQDNGRITLSTESDENTIIVAVTDNGIGIPQEEIPKIFEKFYEIQKSSYHKSGTYEFLSGGAGLGLPIAKAIVELHFGFIEVESEVKKGSKFYIHFPRMEKV